MFFPLWRYSPSEWEIRTRFLEIWRSIDISSEPPEHSKLCFFLHPSFSFALFRSQFLAPPTYWACLSLVLSLGLEFAISVYLVPEATDTHEESFRCHDRWSRRPGGSGRPHQMPLVTFLLSAGVVKTSNWKKWNYRLTGQSSLCWLNSHCLHKCRKPSIRSFYHLHLWRRLPKLQDTQSPRTEWTLHHPETVIHHPPLWFSFSVCYAFWPSSPWGFELDDWAEMESSMAMVDSFWSRLHQPIVTC